MVKECDKRGYPCSIAIEKGPVQEKEAVLRLYSRIGGEKRYYDVDVPMEFREEYGERIEMGGVIEELNAGSTEVIIDGLKKVQYIAGMGYSGSQMLLPFILPLIRFDNDEDVRCEAIKALGKIGDRRAAEPVRIIADSDVSERVKECAVKALGQMKAEEYFYFLASTLNDYWDTSVRVRKAAAFALGRLNPARSVTILCDCLINDPDKPVRQEAAESISIGLLKMEKNSAINIVRAISSQFDFEVEPDADVRLAVINAVKVVEDEQSISLLVAAMRDDPNPRVRGQAAGALAHYFSPEVEKALLASFKKEKDGLKKRIALALAEYAMKNPICLHDEICNALIEIQKIFPRGSYIWKEAVKALPAV